MTHRVALVVEACGGGIGRHILDLAEGLSTRGHAVRLVYSPGRADHLFRARLAQRHRFDYEVVEVEMRRAPGPWDVEARRAVARAVVAFRADVVHAHSSKAGGLVRLSRFGRGTGVVYSPHAWFTLNPTLGRAARLVYGGAEHVLSHRTDRVIVVSEEERDHARRVLRIAADRLALVPNGVSPWPEAKVQEWRRRTRKANGIPEDALTVGFLARMVHQKAPKVAIEALAGLLHARPEVHAIVAGDGELRGVAHERARELGVESRIRWIPVAAGDEVIPAFDVFLMSSLYEGFPYALIEALNAGCALVSTRVGGASACVRDGENGLLVGQPEASALTAALMHVTDDDTRLARMRERSRALASRFSVNTMVDAIIKVYDDTRADAHRD